MTTSRAKPLGWGLKGEFEVTDRTGVKWRYSHDDFYSWTADGDRVDVWLFVPPKFDHGTMQYVATYFAPIRVDSVSIGATIEEKLNE